MKSVFMVCIAASLAGGTVRADCDACIDGLCYKKNLLPGASGRTADIDRNTNTLYVIDANRLLIKKCNLDTATCTDITNQWDIDTIAVDQRTGDVFGSVFSRRGIYKLDFANNKRLSINSSATSIWRLIFKDKLYYASLLKGIYISEGNTSRIVIGTENSEILYFVVDKHDNIYYRTFVEGIRFLQHSTNGTRTVDHPYSWDKYFHAAVDKNGDVMLLNWHDNAVYRVTNGRQVEVGAIRLPDYYYDILLDRDNNLIYVSNGKRYQLKRVSNANCTTSIRDGARIITETRENIETSD